MKAKFVLIAVVTCLFFLANGAFAENQKKSEENKSQPVDVQAIDTKPAEAKPTATGTQAAKAQTAGVPVSKEAANQKESKNASVSGESASQNKSKPAGAKVAKAQTADQKSCKDQIKMKVKGMVCDFCVGSLTKVFKKQPGYAGLDVNLDTGQVTLSMQPGKTLKDETIETLIRDAGYDLKSIHKGCDS